MAMNKTEYAMQALRYGPEPVVDGEVFEHNARYSNVLSWYSAMADMDDAIGFLADFFEANEEIYPNHSVLIRKVPNQRVNMTAAWLARLMMRGAILPDSSAVFFNDKVEMMVSYVDANMTEDGTPKKTVSVQDYIREKASDIIGDLEGMIDDGKIDSAWSLTTYLEENKVTSVIAKRLAQHFEPIANELLDVLNDDDPTLNEGYENVDPDLLIEKAAIYQTLFDEASQYAGENKKPRAPRKIKPVTPEKLLKHFKWAETDEAYGLKSINPKRIIGAQELWTFNTKYKVLSVFKAIDKGGLSVNRTAIDKYDEKNSMAKRIGRKTEERLQEVLTGGKVGLRKLMDSINGDPIPVTRMNDETILLRVV